VAFAVDASARLPTGIPSKLKSATRKGRSICEASAALGLHQHFAGASCPELFVRVDDHPWCYSAPSSVPTPTPGRGACLFPA
jgi:hypothetical protein